MHSCWVLMSLQVSREHEHCSDLTEESWAGRWIYTRALSAGAGASLTHLHDAEELGPGSAGPGAIATCQPTQAQAGRKLSRLQTAGARALARKVIWIFLTSRNTWPDIFRETYFWQLGIWNLFFCASYLFGTWFFEDEYFFTMPVC